MITQTATIPDPIKALMAETLIRLVPPHRSPEKRCWCPSYVDLKYGHCPVCIMANAALAAFEAEKAE